MIRNRRHAALWGMLLLVIFSAVPGYQAPDGHNFVAYYGIVLFAVSMLPVPRSLQILVGVAAASCVWLQLMIANVEPRSMAASFFRLYVSANADFQFVVIFAGLYAMFKIVSPSMGNWLNFLCWIGLIEATRIAAQRLGWDPFYMPMNLSNTIKDAAGSQGNIGWSGMVLAMSAPGFFRRGLWWGLLPILGALYLTKSTTPVIALGGAIWVFAVFKLRPSRALAASTTVFLALVLYNTYDPGDSARFVNWRRALDLIWTRESWLLGYGLGSWILLFPEPGTSFHRAHNEVLQVWFELGLAGILALLLYGRFLIMRFLEAGRSGDGLLASAGMTAVILCAMGNFPFHLAGTAVLAVGWMAMFDLYTRKLETADARV